MTNFTSLTVFAFFAIKKLTCVKLYTWLGSRNTHYNSCYIRFCHSNTLKYLYSTMSRKKSVSLTFKLNGIIFFYAKVVIVSTHVWVCVGKSFCTQILCFTQIESCVIYRLYNFFYTRFSLKIFQVVVPI